MQTNRAIWLVGVLAVMVANHCRAGLDGSDDFNDNSKDPARWGSDVTLGVVGLLTETNGRLEFTTSGVPTPSTLVLRPWVQNFGSYTDNWEVQIDANVPRLGFSETLFGLGVVAGTNGYSNTFNIDLFESSSEGRFLLMKFRADGGSDNRVGQVATSSTSVGLRIGFDANTKVLSAYYDEDGATSGYAWTLLGSTNVSNTWSMTSTSLFGVWVSGRVEGGSVVSASNVFGDNFSAISGTGPSIEIKLAGGKVVVSWPTSTPGYHLQSASALTLPVAWQSVTNRPGMVGTNFTVTDGLSGDKRFYRLSR